MAPEITHPAVDAGKLFSVEGMVIVITGAGSGLGAMMARCLAANGASKVFIIGRRLKALEETKSSAPHGGEKMIPIAGDVTSKESLQAVANEVAQHVDHVDILIANSGISGPRPFPEPKEDKSPPTLAEMREHLWAVPMAEFNAVNEINVTGMFYSALAFLPLLEAAIKRHPAPSTHPRPQIIATGSIGGFNRMPLAGFAYSASKAGVHHLVKTMATVFGKYDIRCNAIAPGIYLSEMSAPVLEAQGIVDAHLEGKLPREFCPATRAGADEDMAGAILYLCSRAGAYVNGNIIVTDGGRLSVFPATY